MKFMKQNQIIFQIPKPRALGVNMVLRGRKGGPMKNKSQFNRQQEKENSRREISIY